MGKGHNNVLTFKRANVPTALVCGTGGFIGGRVEQRSKGVEEQGSKGICN